MSLSLSWSIQVKFKIILKIKLGGAKPIEKFIGQDITEAYKKIESHATKTAAKDMLTFTIGRLKSHKNLESALDEKKLQYNVDLKQPIVWQVFTKLNKKQYLEFIHDPNHMINPPKARLFHSDFLEMFSSTPYWLIPIIWIPIVLYHMYLGLERNDTNLLFLTFFYFVGILSWTLAEYVLHRFFFHVDDKLPDNNYALTFHFIFHGIHHAFPMDE